jgi:CRISPR/Cas system-associated exonuclease Cas4 (RecB family)
LGGNDAVRLTKGREMGSTKASKITAWSYSRWAEYMQCPRKAMYKCVMKLKEPGSPAMDRGSEIHNKLEKYLKGEAKLLPEEAKLLKVKYETIKKAKPEVELSVAFTDKWEKTDWFNWQHAWCRVKIDALAPPLVENPVVSIYDHKTGKEKEHGEYRDQLELYGLTGLLLYPIAEKAKSSLLFVDSGKEVLGEEYPRKDVEKLQKKWILRTKAMLSDIKFKPTPGFHCRYCHFRKSNGGPCPEEM